MTLFLTYRPETKTQNEPDNNIKPMADDIFTDMNHISISVNGVTKLLEGLKVHKATRPDGLPARLLQSLGSIIAPVFYQASLDQGVIPKEWKKADVIPIFKKGAKTALRTIGRCHLLPLHAKCLSTSLQATSFNI